MALTAGEAQNHIRHTLGHDMSSEVNHMNVVNLAGRFLCSAHPWRWLRFRAALLDLEAGIPFVRLPRDFGGLHRVRRTDAVAIGLDLNGLDPVHELQIYGSDGLPWTASVARRTLPPANLVAASESLNDTTYWAYSNGTGTVTPNAAVDPDTGATTVCSVTDADATAVSALTQTIAPRYLTDGAWYTLNVVMRPDPITTTTPPKSAILLSTPTPDTNGRVTRLEVQWGQTPWQNAPTATVIGTNSGEGLAITPVPVGEAYWHFAIGGYQHEHDANYGRMLVSIEPARAAWADASGTTDITQTGKVDVARVWVNTGTRSERYEENTGAITIPRRVEPVLELDQTPTTTSTGALSALYSGMWADAADDDDDLTLPSEGWLDTLYLQVVRAYAKGWEEDGQGTLDARLAQIMSGPIWSAALDHDGRVQGTRGQIKNGAMEMARVRMDAGRFPVAFSNVTPS